jgi:two-component system phosphate regulon response regulator PhoB
MEKFKILCIEDDLTYSTLVQEALADASVSIVSSLQKARHLDTFRYSAIILDLHLPDGEGLRFLDHLKKEEKTKHIPVFVISSDSSVAQKVACFSMGAEDYIVKPFDPTEFHSRVIEKLKRFSAQKEDSAVTQTGNLLIDHLRQKVLLKDSEGSEKELFLTFIEFKILSRLCKNLERVYSRAQLIDLVWGETHISERTVDSHIAHLRKKISESTVEIEPIKNMGYSARLKKP